MEHLTAAEQPWLYATAVLNYNHKKFPLKTNLISRNLTDYCVIILSDR
jgi:hypothetical protein